MASLFPEQPALHETVRSMVAVRGARPDRAARPDHTDHAGDPVRDEVWLIAAGEEKARAIHLALAEAGSVQIPAAGARGRLLALALLDEAAASQTPLALRRIASP